MNRREFMDQLERLLGELPESERVEALRFYNNYFEEAGPENEAGVIQELGSPGRVAAVIRANLDGNQDRGEFTEQGYRDNVQENTPNYPGPAKPVQKERTGSRIFGDRGGFRESQDRQRNAGKMGAGAEAGGSRGFAGADASGGRAPGAEAGDRKTFGDNPGGGMTGDNTNGSGGYGTAGDHAGNYGSTGNSSGGYGPTGNAGGYSYGPQAPRQKRGAGGWALLIILVVFASPVILGIGGGILGLIGGLAGGFLGLLAACIGGGIGLTVGGVVLFVESIVQLFHSPAAGLVGMGGGLIFTALGILLLLAFAWLAFRLLPRIFRAVVNFISRVAHRGRGGNRA